MPPSSSDTDATETVNVEASRYRAVIARLRQADLRATSQRIAILSAFDHDEHLTADELQERASRHSVEIDRATIYRTLERFRTSGILSETDLGDGYRRFELLHDVLHHHVICTICGQTFEFDDDLIQPLRAGIQQRHGFTARIDHLALFGTCAGCASPRHRDTDPPVESPLV